MKKILLKWLLLNKKIYITIIIITTIIIIGWLIQTYPTIFFIKCIPPFHGSHVTLDIEFKLLYKTFILITLVHWRDLNRRSQVSGVPRKKIKEENKKQTESFKVRFVSCLIRQMSKI